MAPIPKSVYLQKDPVALARYFLGKKIRSSVDGHHTSGLIIETEAYRAPDDKACHAYNNRRTKRTETMFKEGGRAYVYLCYGIHHLFNIVTGPNGYAHAVLIRAILPLDGIETMLKRRKMAKIKANLCAGPGTLSQALGIHSSMNDSSFLDKNAIIKIEDTELEVNSLDIQVSPRIGVDYAGECAAWPWRFELKKAQKYSAKYLQKKG